MVRKKPFKIIPVFISELVIILAVFSLSFSFSFAQVNEISFGVNASQNQNTGTLSSTIHRLFCPTSFNLADFAFDLRINTGTQSLGFYLDNIWYATTSVSTVRTWYYLNNLNVPCNKGYIDFKVVSPVNYYSQQTTYSSSVNATTSNVYVVNQTSGLYNTFYANFVLPLTLATSTMGSATTTIITENDQLLNFFLLFSIAFMLVVGIVLLFRPFYVRK